MSRHLLDSAGRTPLYLAAVNNNTAAAVLLIEAGADVNAVDLAGMPLLWKAALQGHKLLVQMLLAAGANAAAALQYAAAADSAADPADTGAARQLLLSSAVQGAANSSSSSNDVSTSSIRDSMPEVQSLGISRAGEGEEGTGGSEPPQCCC